MVLVINDDGNAMRTMMVMRCPVMVSDDDDSNATRFFVFLFAKVSLHGYVLNMQQATSGDTGDTLRP